ncbi:AAA family ATPase [Rhodococcus pyridinivorans]|uniref:AAA family ATPase n=1 Tax=Rhodococcus pyridinivorans TaxID=103816 RepID=UPI002283A4F3|nr:AAA family ATPase [Rhodococcus pyridinivorans]WAL45775.1 AAA family ATPase [Rhodococcus pyridinivorans]
MAVVVMGVSGCGKTTFAKQLADAIGGAFIEADDYRLYALGRGVMLSDPVPCR